MSGIPAADWGLWSALTVSAPIVQVKFLKAGTRIGYDENHRPQHDSHIRLVPLVSVLRRQHIAGTVNMDQFLIALGTEPVPVSTTATILGTDDPGNDRRQRLGLAIGSFGDEIVVRLSGGLPCAYSS